MSQLTAMLARLYNSMDAMLDGVDEDFRCEWSSVTIEDVANLEKYATAVLTTVSGSSQLGWHSSMLRGLQSDILGFDIAVTGMTFSFATDPQGKVDREDFRRQALECLDRARVKMDLLKRRAKEDLQR